MSYIYVCIYTYIEAYKYVGIFITNTRIQFTGKVFTCNNWRDSEIHCLSKFSVHLLHTKGRNLFLQKLKLQYSSIFCKNSYSSWSVKCITLQNLFSMPKTLLIIFLLTKNSKQKRFNLICCLKYRWSNGIHAFYQ